MIISNSFNDSTLYAAFAAPLIFTLPTPRVFLMPSKIAVSFLCKVIEKIGLTLQLVLYLSLG